MKSNLRAKIASEQMAALILCAGADVDDMSLSNTAIVACEFADALLAELGMPMRIDFTPENPDE